MSKEKITNRLKSLEELADVSVTTSGHTKAIIRITHKKYHALEFEFRWSTDHFIGYFMDAKGKKSQAVVSLKTPMHAIKFVAAYAMLNDIHAKQKKPYPE